MHIEWSLMSVSNHLSLSRVHETPSRPVCLGRGASELRAAGFDTVWSGDWSEDPGDDEILSRVTLDKDFGELAIVYGKPHCGIVRLVNISAKQQAIVCIRVLALHGNELEGGAIVTAYTGRLRIRAPNVKESEEQ